MLTSSNSFQVLQSPATPQVADRKQALQQEELIEDEAVNRVVVGPKTRRRKVKRKDKKIRIGRVCNKLKVKALNELKRYQRRSVKWIKRMTCSIQAWAGPKVVAVRRYLNNEQYVELSHDVKEVKVRLAKLEQILNELSEKNNNSNGSSSTSSSSSSSTSRSDNDSSSNIQRKASGRAELAKYERMVAVGVPKHAVIQSMIKDGVDPAKMFPEEASAQKPAAPNANLMEQIKLRRNQPRKAKSNNNNSSGGSKRNMVSLDDLRNVKLRKIDEDGESHQKKQKIPIGNSSGAILSLEQLKGVKLKPTPQKPRNTRKQQSGGITTGDIKGIKLRKTELSRSPGGTPKKTGSKHGRNGRHHQQQQSPSLARSDAEYLELALKKKFASLIDHQTSPMTHTSDWSPRCM